MLRKTTLKSITYPECSAELAEFVGIILGDGGLTRYQLTITLHHYDDKEYIDFVIQLVKKLFNVTPGLYHREKFSVKNIVISRRNMVIFCNEKFNLKVGNKIRQKINIPNWIKENQEFSIACMRGLFDTDGSVVLHRYTVNKKLYVYKKLEFCSISKPLRESVYKVLLKLGMHPRIAREKSVWLDSKNDVKRYFEIIGSHNPKHWKRYMGCDTIQPTEACLSG